MASSYRVHLSLSGDPFHWPLHTLKLSPLKNANKTLTVPVLPSSPSPASVHLYQRHDLHFPSPTSFPVPPKPIPVTLGLKVPQTPLSQVSKDPYHLVQRHFPVVMVLSPSAAFGSASHSSFLSVLEVSAAQEVPALLLCGLHLCLL